VLLVLSLVAVSLVDDADLSSGWKQLVGAAIPVAALLLPVAFFLSIAEPSCAAAEPTHQPRVLEAATLPPADCPSL
jgi:hypothetical protein